MAICDSKRVWASRTWVEEVQFIFGIVQYPTNDVHWKSQGELKYPKKKKKKNVFYHRMCWVEIQMVYHDMNNVYHNRTNTINAVWRWDTWHSKRVASTAMAHQMNVHKM